MIGPLEEDFLYNPYLINLTDISTVNPDIIAHFVVQSIQRTFGNSFNKARFKMFIADGKQHLKKVGEVLQRLYPQLEHISSIEPETDNVNEITRKEFSKEIKVIFETKKILLSSEQRKQRFLKMMKTIDINKSRLSLKSRRDLIIIKWNCKFTDLLQHQKKTTSFSKFVICNSSFFLHVLLMISNIKNLEKYGNEYETMLFEWSQTDCSNDYDPKRSFSFSEAHSSTNIPRLF
ncbi:unnamed protein product [Lepeophtheirus salmonis]|uniref:(salmon louse) hypothetical protein n=1 Tax=Lepeophtheirus salmonis TaxID=72036 RepID=A0A7R8CE74_LEPSM|nr:unnamed protein product [Lepeophtheirus salmonis]CAF2792649.1 unnamed protein product [Lepeophtheirus salmonis]